MSACLIALSVLAACDLSNPCDPGDFEEHGACHPLPVDSGSGAGADASDDDAGADDAATEDPSGPPPGDPHMSFGDECAEQADCPAWLVCGAPDLPYCTLINCMGIEGACPSGWACFPVPAGASPDPTVMSICFRP